MTIGKIIRDARIAKAMTQEELAAKTDISVRTIQRIENDEVDPRSYTLQTIANVLGIDYEELIKNLKKEEEHEKDDQGRIWLPLLHLSGLFILVFPPIIIWVWKKDKVKNIRQHAIDVVNFQLSMMIYFIPVGFLCAVIVGIPIAIFLGIFSMFTILINTIKVINNQPYRYRLSMKILKP